MHSGGLNNIMNREFNALKLLQVSEDKQSNGTGECIWSYNVLVTMVSLIGPWMPPLD